MPISPEGKVIDELGNPTFGLTEEQRRYTAGGGTVAGSGAEAEASANFIRANAAGTSSGRALSGDPTYRYTPPPAMTGEQYQPGGAFGNRRPPTPEEEQAIKEGERKRVQALIDATNEAAATQLSAARERAAQREGRTRATLSSTGQLGSGTETTAYGELDVQKKKEEEAIASERLAKINTILTGVEDRSNTLIKAKKDEAALGAEKYDEFLKGMSTQGKTDMEALAKSGAELSTNQRQKLIEQTGYDPETFDELYKSLKISASKDAYINKDKPQISADGRTATFFRQDKKTGAITAENISLPDTGADPKNVDVVSREDGLYVINKVPNADGTYTTKKVAEAIVKPLSATERKALREEKAEEEANKAVIDDLRTRITDIRSLKDHAGLNSRVGPTAISRRMFAMKDKFGKGQDFSATVKQLTSGETLKTLIEAKSKGATFGALSIPELNLLIDSATKIGNWEVKDEQGIGIGEWEIDEGSFKKELENLVTLTEKAVERKGGRIPTTTTIEKIQIAPDGREIEITD